MFGILNIEKPVGPTSRDCVNQLQHIIKPYKLGHAGTLDPLASGVLVMLVGQAVRLTDAVHELSKEYVGSFELGWSSDSGDSQEQMTQVPIPPSIDRSALEQLLPDFHGLIEQVPPIYSAVWIDGKRAHTLARKGKSVSVPARQVQVDEIELLQFANPKFELRVRCGTGTYIRSIGRDIAARLGTDAVMTQLQRTAVGPFSLSNAIRLSDVCSVDDVRKHLIPAEVGIRHWPRTILSDATITRLLQGKTLCDNELANDGDVLPLQRLAAIDERGVLRALMTRLDVNLWRCDKGFVDID